MKEPHLHVLGHQNPKALSEQVTLQQASLAYPTTLLRKVALLKSRIRTFINTHDSHSDYRISHDNIV